MGHPSQWALLLEVGEGGRRMGRRGGEGEEGGEGRRRGGGREEEGGQGRKKWGGGEVKGGRKVWYVCM